MVRLTRAEPDLARADFTDAQRVQQMVQTIAAVETRLDILVNNAGVEPVMPLESIDMSKFDEGAVREAAKRLRDYLRPPDKEPRPAPARRT